LISSFPDPELWRDHLLLKVRRQNMLIIDTFLMHVSVNACVVAAWCTAFLGGILLFHSIIVVFFFVLSILQRVYVVCMVIFYMVM